MSKSTNHDSDSAPMPPAEVRIRAPTAVPIPDNNSIVEIVECLQQRKMKPDVEKICVYFEKNWPKLYKSDSELVNALVEDCLAKGMIVSVNNQNVTSFRTPSKIGRMLRITKILPYDGEIPPFVVHDIARSIGEIEVAAHNSTDEQPLGSGVSINQLSRHLHQNLRYLNYSDELIGQKVFPLALEADYIVKLSGDLFGLTDAFRKKCNFELLPPEPSDLEDNNEDELIDLDSGEEKSDDGREPMEHLHRKSKSPEKFRQLHNSGDSSQDGFKPATRRRQNDTMIDMDDEADGDSKSGFNSMDADTPGVSSPSGDGKNLDAKDLLNVPQRVSTRKKFKKSLGPDFVDTSEQLMYYLKESNTPKCCNCAGGFQKTFRSFAKKRYPSPELEPADTNMIQCSKCELKAHVLCLTLTESVGLKYQWRCGSCGTCVNCKQNKKKDFCITCKSCKRSYHTFCCRIHRNIDEPTDNAWECERCYTNRTVDSAKNSSSLLNKSYKSSPIVSTSSASQVDTSKNRTTSSKPIAVTNQKSLINKLPTPSVTKSNTSLLSKSMSSGDSSSSSQSLLMPISSQPSFPKASSSKSSEASNHQKAPPSKPVINEFVDKHLNGISVDKQTANLLSNPAVREFLLRGPHLKKNLNSGTNNVLRETSPRSENHSPNSDISAIDSKLGTAIKTKLTERKLCNSESVKEKHYFNFKDVFDQKAPVEIKQNFVAWVNCELRHYVKFDPTPLYTLHNNINRWSTKDVHTFLSAIGFNATAEILLDNNVDGIALMLLRREDILERLSLKMGPALKLYAFLDRLRHNLDEVCE